ncbi:MAG: helix-turn-helix domain-containing protein [Tannerellaceae bacterium]
MLMVIVASVFVIVLLTTGLVLLNINEKRDLEIVSFTKPQLGLTNIVWAILIGILIVLRINESAMHSGFFLRSLKAVIAIIIIPFLYLYASNKYLGGVACFKRYAMNLLLPVCLLFLWVFFIIVSKTTQVFQWGSFNYVSFWKALEYSYITILLLQIGFYTVLLMINSISQSKGKSQYRLPVVRCWLLGVSAGILWVYSLLNHQTIYVIASYVYLSFLVALLFYIELKGLFKAKAILVDPSIEDCSEDPEAIVKDVQVKESDNMRLIIERIDNLLFEEKVYKSPDITLSSLARMVPTNETYLREAIKRHYNCSYTDLLNECRLTEVECMLLEKEAQVNELYEEVGFNSSSAFYAAFKRKHNMTPTQWTQRYKQ